MLTVQANEKGVRITRVGRGGEEILTPDLEARLLAALLWTKMGQRKDETVPVFPQLESAVTDLRTLRDEVRTLLNQGEKFLMRLDIALAQAKAKPVPIFTPPPPTAQ
jgi:hypothetical protein